MFVILCLHRAIMVHCFSSLLLSRYAYPVHRYLWYVYRKTITSVIAEIVQNINSKQPRPPHGSLTMSSSSCTVSKQNTSSAPMWAYFGVKVDEAGKATDDGVVICYVCNAAVKARGNNTSSLVSHLKVHHPLKNAEVVKKQELKKHGSRSKSVGPGQTTISCTFERAIKYERGGKKWNKLIAFCLAKDMMPLHVYSVEKEGFRRMLNRIDSKHDLPGCKYLHVHVYTVIFEIRKIPVLFLQYHPALLYMYMWVYIHTGTCRLSTYT